MASGGGKNVILLIIAVAAIGGAIYGITSMKEENPQNQQMVYLMDPESVHNDPQDVAIMTTGELAKRRDEVLLSTEEANKRRLFAGKCPHCEKFFPLEGHGANPANCPVCKESLEDH